MSGMEKLAKSGINEPYFIKNDKITLLFSQTFNKLPQAKQKPLQIIVLQSRQTYSHFGHFLKKANISANPLIKLTHIIAAMSGSNQQTNYKLEQFLQSEAYKCFRMYKTILEVMEYRQYIVPEESQRITFEEFNDLFENKELRDKREIFPPLEMEEHEEIDPSIAVFYNFSNEDMTAEYINRITKSCERIRKFFLVAPLQTKGKNTPFTLDKKAQSHIAELTRKDRSEKYPYRVEIFRQDELYFNVLKHDLVPPHRLLSETQKIELLQKYKIKESQLPKILLSDPVAKFLGLRRGQIVKISRKSETAGTYTTYRITI